MNFYSLHDEDYVILYDVIYVAQLITWTHDMNPC